MAKLDIARTVFFSEVFHQMVKSAETVDPREGRKNIPTLPSRSQSQLVSSGTSHLGSVKPPGSRWHRGVWVLNHSLGNPCFVPLKLSTGFIRSRGRTSTSAEVMVVICETLNEIFFRAHKEEEPCHWITAPWVHFGTGKELGFYLHQWGCVREYLKGSNKGYTSGVYINGGSLCVLLLCEMATSEVSLHLYHICVPFQKTWQSSFPQDLLHLQMSLDFCNFLVLGISEKYLENWNYLLKKHLILLLKYWSGGSTFKNTGETHVPAIHPSPPECLIHFDIYFGESINEQGELLGCCGFCWPVLSPSSLWKSLSCPGRQQSHSGD